MPKKSSKKRRKASKPKKTVCCDDDSCCSGGLNLTFWPIVFIAVGVVWLVEHYVETDIPLVAIVILLVGLFMLFKKKKD